MVSCSSFLCSLHASQLPCHVYTSFSSSSLLYCISLLIHLLLLHTTTSYIALFPLNVSPGIQKKKMLLAFLPLSTITNASHRLVSNSSFSPTHPAILVELQYMGHKLFNSEAKCTLQFKTSEDQILVRWGQCYKTCWFPVPHVTACPPSIIKKKKKICFTAGPQWHFSRGSKCCGGGESSQGQEKSPQAELACQRQHVAAAQDFCTFFFFFLNTKF